MSASAGRRFRSLQALHMKPLKRNTELKIPVCDLQLRSYSVRNLSFFADFALRAAYYLNLSAGGPIALPRIVERWTVPRSNFIFKKSQENFERITTRRVIQIYDGHADSVKLWLALLRRRQFHGVGMKANIWTFEGLDISSNENSHNVNAQVRWPHTDVPAIDDDPLTHILANTISGAQQVAQARA